MPAAITMPATLPTSLDSNLPDGTPTAWSVLAGIDDQFIVLDGEFRYCYVNQQAVEITGLAREKLLGQVIWEVFAAVRDSAFERELRRAANERTSVTFEHYYGPLDSWFENRVYVGTHHLALLVRDITERKRHEAVLMESEARYRSLAEALRRSEATFRRLADANLVGVGIGDLQGGVTYINDEMLRMMGYTRAEYEAGRVNWMECLAPEVRQRSEEINAELRRKGRVSGYRHMFVRPDGTRCPYVGSAALLESGSDIHVSIALDLTPMEEAQAKARQALEEVAVRELARADELAALMESAPVGVWIGHDPECRMITGNDHGYALVRMPSPTNLSLSAKDKSGPADYTCRIDGTEVAPDDLPMQKAARTGRALWNVELELLFRDGQSRFIMMNAVPLRTPDGRIRGCIASGIDITESKRTEERLEALVEDRTAKLRQSIGELEAFSYSISHDMRAPLRAMESYTRILLEDHAERLDAEGRRMLERIGKSAARLDLLIRDVLAYSRLAKSELTKIRVDLDTLVEELISGLGLSPAQIRVMSTLPQVWGHEALLSQIFSNLITNAVKFAHAQRPPEIRIWANRVGDEWVVNVADNGIGIESHHHERIFEIFGQVYPTGEYEGTGIGLAIVKKAVERLGGRIGLESKMGHGTRFWFTLQPADATAPAD